MPRLFASQQPLMQLREYQFGAFDALHRHLLKRSDNPVAVLPTGSGKTLVIAYLCYKAVIEWRGRVIVIEPSKELIRQTADKLEAIAPQIDFGIYCAGLNRYDTREPVIIASIQSVYDKACDLGRFDLIVPDEAQGIPPDGEGRYRTFIGDCKKINPNVRVAGLTATPYRMTTGPICTPDGILNSICYEVGVRELIAKGFLCPLISKPSSTQVDLSGVHIRGGEYVAEEVEAVFNVDNVVDPACREIVAKTQDRRKVLIFTAGIDHGLHVCHVLKLLRQNVRFISGDMSSQERDRIISSFPDDDAKYLVNVKVLTTGYDCPSIDCVVPLHSTLSPGLYYQECGRGFRLHPDKRDCLILDFGGNIAEHGPIDLLKAKIEAKQRGRQGGAAVTKECPECDAVIAAGYARCPHCGFEFPEPEKTEAKHGTTASEEDILSGRVTQEPLVVESVSYAKHYPKGDEERTPSLRVDYEVGPGQYKHEYICLEHFGRARKKAVKWWQMRSNFPVPDTIDDALYIARRGGLADTFAILYQKKKGEKYGEILKHDIGEKPSEELEVLAEDSF